MSLNSEAAQPLDRGRVLVAIAREAIEHADDAIYGLEVDWLRRPAATFVTLRLAGELRGCIGTLEPHRALGMDVALNARAAAYRDPRFGPVTVTEIPRLQLEVSLLSPQTRFEFTSEADALSKLRPGIDGLCFIFREMRSTFLPQVWESLPDPREFLCELKRKAGLPSSFWHEEVRLTRYTVERFK